MHGPPRGWIPRTFTILSRCLLRSFIVARVTGGARIRPGGGATLEAGRGPGAARRTFCGGPSCQPARSPNPPAAPAMPYVVTEACINCKHTDCVEVCPVDCFYEGPNFLAINPDECIDCNACVPVCPVQAIYADELSEASAAAIADLARTQWARLRAELIPELERLIEADQAAGRAGTHRARLGLFTYNEPDPEHTDAKPPAQPT